MSFFFHLRPISKDIKTSNLMTGFYMNGVLVLNWKKDGTFWITKLHINL